MVMIKRDGHYILTIEDWNLICKHFMINPRTVNIREFPQLTFTETRVFDVYTKKVLFSIYDHDGMIRIPGEKNTFAYEIDINKILTKNPEMPSQQALDLIKKNVHNGPAMAIKNVTDKIVEKTTGRKPSAKR